jgi:outer membrane protein assembly complex protein YaeT
MKRFKELFLFGVLSALLSGAFGAEGKIVFQNISPEIQKELQEKFPEMNAGDLPEPVIDNLLRAISVHEDLDAVSAEKNAQGDLVIKAELKRSVGKISFAGNAHFSKSRLEEVLKIQPGNRFDRKRALESAQAVKDLYGEAGYFNAVVEAVFDQDPGGSVHIAFTITENEPCRIQAIQIDTANGVLKQRLQDHVKKFRKKPLTQEVLNSLTASLRDFFIDGSYLTAAIKDSKIEYNEDKTQAVVSLNIQNPYQWQFNVRGNKDKTLSEVYQVLNLSDPERKNIDPISESIDRLRRYYLQEGYPHVKIDHKEVKVTESFINRVFLDIEEGPKVIIAKYQIEGRISRPPSYYVRQIQRHSTPLVHRGYYNREDIEVGINNLLAQLKNQGFLKSRMQSMRVEFSKDRKQATVVINMDEGSLTQIRSITFEGNSFFSARELISVFGMETRAPLRLIALERGIQRLKDFYQHQGFMEMKILNEDETLVSYNDKGTLAEINFKLYEGPRIRVADIVLEGNTFTKGSVIRKEADLNIGQILNPEIIEEALDRLNRLGIFSRVDIHTLEEGTAIAERTVIISVTERDPGVFRVGAGVNSERDLTARGFIGLGYNNLGGTARAVSGRAELNYNIAQINYPEYEFSVGYLEPFLFNSRNKGRINLTRSETVFEYLSKEDLTSITQSEKAEFTIERQFSKVLRGTWKVWGIDRRKDFEAHGKCLTDDTNYPAGPCSPSIQQVAKIGPSLDLDYRDNPFLPTQGSFSKMTLEYSDPHFGSSQGIRFWKADTQYSKYIRLAGNSKWIWANSLRGGYLQSLDSSGGIPANQAFFLGGIYTVRGFDSSSDNERIPPGWELDVPKSTSIIVTDDSYYGLFKTELRFPISGEHGGVIFYDGGIVEVTGVPISRPYRDSVGIGYRYNTPVGPLSLDLAFKIRPRTKEGEREEPFRIHFSIGTF